jgi:hypothetical protein
MTAVEVGCYPCFAALSILLGRVANGYRFRLRLKWYVDVKTRGIYPLSLSTTYLLGGFARFRFVYTLLRSPACVVFILFFPVFQLVATATVTSKRLWWLQSLAHQLTHQHYSIEKKKSVKVFWQQQCNACRGSVSALAESRRCPIEWGINWNPLFSCELEVCELISTVPSFRGYHLVAGDQCSSVVVILREYWPPKLFGDAAKLFGDATEPCRSESWRSCRKVYNNHCTNTTIIFSHNSFAVWLLKFSEP